MTTEPGHPREAVEAAAATWIARRDAAGWTAADAAALEAWLAESPGHRVAYYRLNAAWERAGRLQGTRAPSRLRPLAIAATVLLLIAAALVAMRTDLFRSTPDTSTQPAVANVTEAAPPAILPVPPETTPMPAAVRVEPGAVALSPAPRPQRYATAIGASRSVALADGSRVTLDTDSQIRVSMDGLSRTVHLDRGQAYFEVAKDEQRPFAVVADRLRVVAVGTAFSVRRVATDIRVVVAEGTVRVDDDGALSAGGTAHVEGDDVKIAELPPAEVERTLSWRSGMLTFRHTPLAAAADEFNRYSTRKLVIRDASIASLELGGVFRSSDVEAFAQVLEGTLPVDAVILPDRIELTARSALSSAPP